MSKTKEETEPHDYQRREKALDSECNVKHVSRHAALSEWTCKTVKDGTLRPLTAAELEILSYGSLSKYEIDAEIRSKLHGIKVCFEKFLNSASVKKHPDRNKSMRDNLKFTIESEGKVTEATGHFVRYPPDSQNLLIEMSVAAECGQCIQNVVRTYEYPPPRGGGIVRVTYPFVFSESTPPASPSP